jgi:hypothetical protein
MALITVHGEPGCRVEEVTSVAAQHLGWELVTEAKLRRLLEQEFGSIEQIPDRAYPYVVTSVLARLAVEHHLVTSADGTEILSRLHMPGLLRVRLIAPENWRVGTVLLERRLDRQTARAELARLDREARERRRRRFGRGTPKTDEVDLALNVSTLDTDAAGATVQAAAAALRLSDAGLLGSTAEAQIQFRVRLELSRHGMSPPDRVKLTRQNFVHPSEEMFARLLDFYRIAWEYEPKSFPIQWDRAGKVLEAFTPDFYLPEFDLYLELTTMKQANVTRKNRKIKLVKQLYPDVNIRVFYQKDFENLIFKYGLGDRAGTASPQAVEA